MKINAVKLEGHPGCGDVYVNFCDQSGSASSLVVLAGGNGTGKTAILDAIQTVFEGRAGQNIGRITLFLEIEDLDRERFKSVSNPPHIPDEIKGVALFHDSSEAATRNWQEMFGLSWTGHGWLPADYTPMMGSTDWLPVFRSFYSEANVNFVSPTLQNITSTTVDPSKASPRRSGSKIAEEITQLIVDIRASDAEDLAVWVRDNPGVAPPSHVQNIRFTRFLKAFEYMFPTKRFKEVKRGPQSLTPEFIEFGRISSLDKLSTGEKQIVFRAGFLLRDLATLPSSVILVDEPELSLHPDWQGRITGFYRHLLSDNFGNYPQIIFATHSPFIVHGAISSKIVVLEKSPITGKIRAMDDPAYPGVTADEAVRAFDLDSFLSDVTRTDLLVLVEGESDAIIIKTAWEKLYPKQRMPFELRAALGAKNINVTLGDDQIGNKLGERKLVGLFDFDEAYNQWKGLWKGRSVPIESSEANGLSRRHPEWDNVIAMLLPVPDSRIGYASRALAGSSILSIEFLFDDNDHLPYLILEKPLAAGRTLPQVNSAMKVAFAAHVMNLDASSFGSFVPLFARFTVFLEA